MRVLLAGVLGAAAAAVAWMAIEHTTKQEFNWMPIAVGLITGLAVHCASRSNARSSFGRGFLAVVLTLIVCVGSRQAYAKFMERTGMNQPAQLAEISGEKNTAGSDDADSEKNSQPAELVIPVELPEDTGTGAMGKGAFQQDLSPWDMIWLSAAALVAYVVGKGREQAAATHTETESPEPEENEPA